MRTLESRCESVRQREFRVRPHDVQGRHPSHRSIDSPAGVSVLFSGSITLPPLAPTAVLTANFTFRGGFFYRLPNGADASVLFNDTHGIATVYLSSPLSPFFPNSWHVDRVLYQLDQAPLPGRWTYGDIGDVGQAGSSGFSNGQFQVSGSGGDIWGTADAFHYLFTTADHGPSGVVARVDSFSAGQPFAKAGVMVRRTLEASSPHVILDVKPDGGVEFDEKRTRRRHHDLSPARPRRFLSGCDCRCPPARRGPDVLRRRVVDDGRLDAVRERL
jgi:hypothetical protein